MTIFSPFCCRNSSLHCSRRAVRRTYTYSLFYKMAITIQDADDLKNRLAEAGNKLVLIDFKATWCGPCKIIGPKIEELANEFIDSVVVLKIDVDDCEDIAADYDVSAMPTFVFIKNSQKLEEFSGANFDKLKNTLLKHK